MVSTSVINHLTDPVAWETVSRDLGLSGRERQIVRLVLEDRKESAIAQDLGVSRHTIHTHLDRLYRKLSVSSRLELVLRVVARFIELTSERGSALPPICGRECPLGTCASSH